MFSAPEYCGQTEKAVYGGCTGNVLKWFPDHRGLCAGIVSGAYGIGTAVTVAPIETMIKAERADAEKARAQRERLPAA